MNIKVIGRNVDVFGNIIPGPRTIPSSMGINAVSGTGEKFYFDINRKSEFGIKWNLSEDISDEKEIEGMVQENTKDKIPKKTKFRKNESSL